MNKKSGRRESVKDKIGRRDFIRGGAVAGLSAPLLASKAVAESAPATRPSVIVTAAARPVVMSSSNNHTGADGRPLQGGVKCVTRAMEIIRGGGDTLDAVVAGVNIVEDDPLDDSVGYGGLPNEECEVELDASVMHGPTRRAGAVANLHYIKNPSKVAKLVLERTDHVLLVGEGALRFALKHGFKKEDLLTESSRKAWLAWRESLNDHDNWGPSWHRTAPNSRKKAENVKLSPEEVALSEYIADRLRNRRTGTINCLAVDANGDISGVTTTSGLAWKIPGRVGDSPLVGCGLYVDNEVGAAGSTGRGEECIYINGSHTVVEMMRRGTAPTDAAMEAVKRIAARYDNDQKELDSMDISFYAVNKKGEYGAACLWKGGQFALHDGTAAKVMNSVWLYERKPS
ncbi:MAG TPA: N(4)-(beta-N-acetylglucosaminyl)-L-asparaginase [Blastocatellia bacterium]|nr:N(4)-(beta-N-acetylglucosaminyl)-L-asparaginase [Blastocatellia bacterium]